MSLLKGNCIAIIGSAPSSIKLGPYHDQNWDIWGCSPGVYGAIPRKTVWFEQHRWEPSVPGYPEIAGGQPWFSPEYVRFMEEFDGPVFMSEPVDSVKNCHLYPYKEMKEKHGPYHFTSTVAWMLALAIEQKPHAIGLWGVDMAASSEYAFQRPGCQHFLGLASSLGIKVVLPMESDLLQPPTLYGICEVHPRHIRLMARKRELEARLANATNQINGFSQESTFLKGALDDVEYMLNTWVDDIDPRLEIERTISKAGSVYKPIILTDELVPIERTDAFTETVKGLKPKKRGRPKKK